MIKSFSTEMKLLILVASFFFVQTRMLAPALIDRTDYLSPPIEIKNLSMGFAPQMSDSFWLRAIQDFDFCDHPVNEQKCTGKSWLFNVINLVVELDNKFLEAFYYGGLALTVLISDYDGATIIFDKGVKEFPSDWHLHYAAAYHALFEEKDKIKASNLYLSASEHGAPEWVKLMAGRLASEGGDNVKAKEILQQLIEADMNPAWTTALKKKILKMERSKGN